MSRMQRRQCGRGRRRAPSAGDSPACAARRYAAYGSVYTTLEVQALPATQIVNHPRSQTLQTLNALRRYAAYGACTQRWRCRRCQRRNNKHPRPQTLQTLNALRRYAAYGGVYTVLEVLALPAVPLTMTAGLLFGVGPGVAVVSVSSTAAATISFLIARYAGARPRGRSCILSAAVPGGLFLLHHALRQCKLPSSA